MPSLSANDVYEVAADVCQKPGIDFIVSLSRHGLRVTRGQGSLAGLLGAGWLIFVRCGRGGGV